MHRESEKMRVVIQCAASKSHKAGYLQDNSGRNVNFVALPIEAPKSSTQVYAHPDDKFEGMTWRERLIAYNAESKNPLNLLPAYQLYSNPAYGDLVDALGSDKVYILSAGWGLLSADFLTPYYDITFSNSAEKYKRRSKRDRYNDINQLDNNLDEDVVFFGGKDYLLLFCELTSTYKGKRFIYSSSVQNPKVDACRVLRYETTTRTNWHYECVREFIRTNMKLSDLSKSNSLGI